jgi:phosphatidylinositol alpha-mannosyltransferase
MKIALVSPYDFPYPGGVTEHIIALANGVRQRGHEVHILAACSGYKGEICPFTQPVAHKVTTIPIGGAMARVGLSPLSYLRIKKILQYETFDVIHLQEPLTPSITWWVLWHTRHLSGTVTIGTFHAYHEQPNWLYQRGRPIFGRLFNRLDSLIAVSHPAYRFAYQMFPGDYEIIPNGIDLKRFGKSLDVTPYVASPDSNKKTTILFVGRLDKRKGFSNLLEAFIKIKPDYSQLQLQVIGPFELQACQHYQKMAQIHHVTDIDFVGYVSPEQLPNFYLKADIFCAPSIGFESFGIVLLEAMAAGLPVVASNIAGYRSVITDGLEGLLVPPGQPAHLANALRQLLNHPHQRREMGRRGRSKANHYSWEHIVDKTLDIYMNTIKRKIKTGHKFLSRAEFGHNSNDPIPWRRAGYVERTGT